MIQWIDVKDKLPELESIVLVKDSKGNWGSASLYNHPQLGIIWSAENGDCCPYDYGFFDAKNPKGKRIAEIEVTHWVCVE